MAKYRVLTTHYGLRNKLWKKDDIVELNPDEKPNPVRFEPVKPGAEKTKPKPENKPKPVPASERKDLIAKAKAKGIANAHMLNNRMLKEAVTGVQDIG